MPVKICRLKGYNLRHKGKTYQHEWEQVEGHTHVHLECILTSPSLAVAADCEDWWGNAERLHLFTWDMNMTIKRACWTCSPLLISLVHVRVKPRLLKFLFGWSSNSLLPLSGHWWGWGLFHGSRACALWGGLAIRFSLQCTANKKTIIYNEIKNKSWKISSAFLGSFLTMTWSQKVEKTLIFHVDFIQILN